MSLRLSKYFLSALLLFCGAAARGQTPAADSLWNEIRLLTPDTTRVNAVIRNAQWLHSRLKNSREEESLLQKGLALAEAISYKKGIAECENLLGVFKRENSHYEDAITLHHKALRLAEELDDSVLMAYTLNNLGVAYRRLDQNQKAFRYHLQALKIAEAAGNIRNQTVAINSIGNIQLSLGNYTEAIDEFKKSLGIEIQAKNNLGIAINYANIGAAREGLGDLGKAIPLYEKSLAYNKLAKSFTGIAICCNLLGNAYMKKGDYGRAIGYLRRALSVHSRVHDKINVAENYITIGKILMKQHKIDSALHSIHRGLAIADQINSPSMMIEAWQAIAGAEQQKGHYHDAYSALQEAYRYRDSLYIQQASPQMAKMRTLYELDKKDNQIKLLRQANQIKLLKLKRHRLIAVSSLVILLLILVALILYNRQRRIYAHRSIIQYELQALRSQMNPHFIFNSLNSIHKFIWSNEQDQASEYLAKFSRLMRLILENTRFRSVVLTNEIEFLHLYLELESVRCNNKFSASIHVSPELDPDTILVPAMIIQPFVENAIWHGLIHKEGKEGRLDIRFYRQNNLLHCEVEDNGIGRVKAKEIKAEKAATHQSLGMQVTEERVQLLKEITKNKDTLVHVIDVENDRHEALGTKVILQLPLEYAF